jgi:hypothetical protein
MVWFGLFQVVLGCGTLGSLNYIRLVCEREMLTIDYFAMLVVGFPAYIQLSC